MRNFTSVWLVACLVVLSATAPTAAQQPATDATVEALAYTGDGAVPGTNETRYLWNDSAHEFTVTVAANGSFDGEVCLVSERPESNQTRGLACTAAAASATNSTTEATISVDSWPANATGTQEIRALLRSANASEAVDRSRLSVIVIRRTGDLDDDGLSNEQETRLGTDIQSEDTDGDGLTDQAEVQTYETSPTTPDTDGDGISDHDEIHTHGTDPTSVDSDDDGLPDAEELNAGSNPTNPDSDGDGLADGAEVNVHGTAPTNPDSDGDGLDDGAEVNRHETNPLQTDTDGDGLDDALEVNTYGSDPRSVDSDEDGLGDGQEVGEYQSDPTDSDTDGDGLPDGKEVKTFDTNPTDPDTDGDGLTDGKEVAEYDTDPNAADSDGDGRPDGAEVERSGLSWLTSPLGLLGGVGLALVLVVSVGLYTRSDRDVHVPVLDGRLESVIVALQSEREATSAGSDDDGPPRDAGATAEAQSTDETATEAAGTESHENQPSTDVPPEFMSNEQRVLTLLSERDGRMEQSAIVEETGWSKSKVSRVLSEMEAEDQVVKIDVGAGNVVTVPENVPPGVESPLDD